MKIFEVPLLFDHKPTWPALLDPPSIPYTVNDYAPAKGGIPQLILRERQIPKTNYRPQQISLSRHLGLD